MGNAPHPLHGSADPRRVIYRFRRPFLFFFPFEPDGLFERDESFEPDGARRRRQAAAPTPMPTATTPPMIHAEKRSQTLRPALLVA